MFRRFVLFLLMLTPLLSGASAEEVTPRSHSYAMNPTDYLSDKILGLYDEEFLAQAPKVSVGHPISFSVALDTSDSGGHLVIKHVYPYKLMVDDQPIDCRPYQPLEPSDTQLECYYFTQIRVPPEKFFPPPSTPPPKTRPTLEQKTIST
jgi:hypothetical protein